MCGINGIIKSNINKHDINNVTEMNKVLSHRGPDNSEIWSLNDTVFGHTRLAIIDLNSRSNQPFKKDNLIGKDTRFKKSFSTLKDKTLNGSISPNVLDPMKVISPND